MAHFYISSYAVEPYGSAPSHRFFHPPIRQDVALDMSVKKLHAIKQAQRSSHRQAGLLKTVLVYNMFKAAMDAPAVPHTAAADVGVSAASAIENAQPLVSVQDGAAQPAASLDMDIDISVDEDEHASGENGAAAAEQSWFDRCIDRMLTEDDMDDQPENAPEHPQYLDDDATVSSLEFNNNSHFVPLNGQKNDNSGGILKRSPSSASIQSLCMASTQSSLQTIDHYSNHMEKQLPITYAPSNGAAAEGNKRKGEDVRWQGATGYTHVDSHPWQYANLFSAPSVSLEAQDSVVSSACIY
ncbi:hypothetical protein BX070DRAFT_254058 [Coemansia spiralis]|nr:hypothetical protein BX070DRAFT_254058 [Coemansia spiralis]